MNTILAAMMILALPARSEDVPKGLDSPLSLTLSKTPLKSALKLISQESGLRFRVSASVGNPKVTLALDKVTAREALESLAKAKGLAFDPDPDGQGFLVRWRDDDDPEPPSEKDVSPLDIKVALMLSDAPLKELLWALEVQSGLKFYYPRELGEILVSAQVTSSTVREVLEMISSVKRLQYKIDENTIHIDRLPEPGVSTDVRGPLDLGSGVPPPSPIGSGLPKEK